jgi:hypothetical protein
MKIIANLAEEIPEYDTILPAQVNQVKNSRIIFSDIKNFGMRQKMPNYGLEEIEVSYCELI